MYLETKRQIFPRFYFLSNDDLLEILGQSRNPEAVQPHLKKCFDNIVALSMAKASMGSKFEAAMAAANGESVPFVDVTTLDGPVEAWLCDIEKNMRDTIKEELRKAHANLKRMLIKRDKWVKEHPGQLCISAGQIQWTADVTKALGLSKERDDQRALKSLKKKQVAMLNKFSEAIRGNLTQQQRLKIVVLVTIEVHARDILEKLVKSKVADASAFEWLSQLRMYWDREIDDCVVRQTNTQFQQGYEYLGNSGRLVITPLTDRCYMTLTTALHLHRGGGPKGPAGTGKTETVKDLGKALGNYLIVANCSEGLDFKSMGRMFSGLSRTGAWGCSDEFNRINIESPHGKGIGFNGPVDTLWTESRNSVMDDNKILTLINRERISMPQQVSLLFEMDDLSVASPATVSRCGMVYYDYSSLGWPPTSWLGRRWTRCATRSSRRR